MPVLLDFAIVGAAKSGTRSLATYLSYHSGLCMASRKESHFYSAPYMPLPFAGPGDDGLNHTIVTKEAHYRELFRSAKPGQLLGEASAFYLYYPHTAAALRRAMPNGKIIVILRNPVERAFSAYMHLRRDGRETLSFGAALDQEKIRIQSHYEPL